MQPVEAILHLITATDNRVQHARELIENPDFDTSDPEWQAGIEKLELAVSVASAMLNTALPVARFRCFVKIESGPEENREFTISSPHIEDIVAALAPWCAIVRKVYVTLWEQRATGADMVEAYQGMTRSRGKKHLQVFLNQLQKYAATVPMVQ